LATFAERQRFLRLADALTPQGRRLGALEIDVVIKMVRGVEHQIDRCDAARGDPASKQATAVRTFEGDV
jgi:hypothetical protein